MTREDFILLREEAIKREGALLLVKGAEYHSDEDFLENFKGDGLALGVDPIKTLMIHASKHWRSITRFARTGRDSVEGIEGRVDDLINYMHLLLGLVKERRLGEGVVLKIEEEEATGLSYEDMWRRMEKHTNRMETFKECR